MSESIASLCEILQTSAWWLVCSTPSRSLCRHILGTQTCPHPTIQSSVKIGGFDCIVSFQQIALKLGNLMILIRVLQMDFH